MGFTVLSRISSVPNDIFCENIKQLIAGLVSDGLHPHGGKGQLVECFFRIRSQWNICHAVQCQLGGPAWHDGRADARCNKIDDCLLFIGDLSNTRAQADIGEKAECQIVAVRA